MMISDTFLLILSDPVASVYSQNLISSKNKYEAHKEEKTNGPNSGRCCVRCNEMTEKALFSGIYTNLSST